MVQMQTAQQPAASYIWVQRAAPEMPASGACLATPNAFVCDKLARDKCTLQGTGRGLVMHRPAASS